MNTTDSKDITTLLAAWPVAHPQEITPMSGGTNNRIWLIHTEDEQELVLRIVPGQHSLARIQHEDHLLTALDAQQLPFALPLLIKTHDGAIALPLTEQGGKDTQSWATLTTRLPGELTDRPPQRHNLLLAHAAGTTLAFLDTGLAKLPLADFQAPEVTTFGDLAHCHPLVPDPLIAIEQLPIDREPRKQLQSQFSSIIEQTEKLYEELPQQILHRDYDPGNVLVKDNRITAVLDFDFSGIDIRIFDLSIALSWWPYRATGTEREWEIIDTFGAAYIARFPLSTAELQAIPDVMRLRDAVSFVHRAGRYLAGLETDTGIRDRVHHSFWREAWLTNNRSKLLQHIARWNNN